MSTSLVAKNLLNNFKLLRNIYELIALYHIYSTANKAFEV